MHPAAEHHTPPGPNQQFGEDIAFGLEQTLLCLSTDFIDPYIAQWMQEKDKGGGHGTIKQNWIGEIAGDLSAFFGFLALRGLFRPAFDSARDGAQSLLEPVYDWLGRKEMKLAKGAPLDAMQAEKLEQWKSYQADNLVKSSVVSAVSIGANVATQRAIGNTHSWKVILTSKLVGAAITMSGMLGLRLGLPHTMKSLDSELSRRYFAPVITATQKAFGVASPTPVVHAAQWQGRATPLASMQEIESNNSIRAR